MTDERHAFCSDGVTATVAALGAELQSLCDGAGREYLWQAAEPWTRHAPVLFPIIGRLAQDRLRHAGRDYRMTQHGFARDRVFAWTRRDAAGCTLLLTDDAASRETYPFAFRLELDFSASGGALRTHYALTNTGESVLPAALGTHPGFAWPLPGAAGAAGHALTFDQAEPAPIRRLDSNGLLLPDPRPTPVEGHRLPLHAALFEPDAIIFDQLHSRRVRFHGPGAPGIEVAWDNFPQLGVWQRPGAPYLCIEPWHGFTSPLGWDGEFLDKPGNMRLAPGETRHFRLEVRLL